VGQPWVATRTVLIFVFATGVRGLAFICRALVVVAAGFLVVVVRAGEVSKSVAISISWGAADSTFDLACTRVAARLPRSHMLHCATAWSLRTTQPRRLTLRSSQGPPPAWHLARATLWSIIRRAGQAPRRFRPLSSNVRPHRNQRAKVTHMSVCPACKQIHGVTEVRVWTASALFPATCRACGARFHPGSTASTVLAELVFFPFSLVAAFASPSAMVAVIALLGFAVTFVAIRALVSLVPAAR
jgi:hypothetical protein